jgi:membrane protein DedA with SNARE-associated domain
MTEWTLRIVERLGYIGVLVLITLENLIPPIPSEVVLPLAGFSVGQGKLNFFGVLVASTGGGLIGALILYFIGQHVGERRLREFIRSHSWIPLFSEEDIDRAHGWFERHGGATVFFGRLVPFVRSAISLPAGFSGMPLVQFILYTTVGSAIWNGVLIGLGWWLGARWESVSQYAKYFEYAVLALLAVLIGRFIWRRWRGGDAQTAGEAS